MSLLRAVLMTIFVSGLALSPVLAQAVGATTADSLSGTRQFLVAAGNGNNGNGGNDNNGNSGNDNNGNGGNGNGGNGNGGNGNGGNGNGGNGNGGNGNGGNGNGDRGAVRSSGPVFTTGGGSGAGGGSACAPAGRDTTIASADGRVTVHVFPTISRNVRISIAMPVDSATVPTTPGQKVDALLFQLTADDCAGGAISTLPAEVNLGARYGDQDAAGLTESKFVIARLDATSNTWKPVDKQAADPTANLVSATITLTGFYVVYQAP